MTHQKYATDYHAPVLVNEVLHWLDVQPGRIFLDGTAGGGGHCEAILEASFPDGKVIALDRDQEAIAESTKRLTGYGDRFQIYRRNYSEASQVLAQLQHRAVDGWLVDAGVSSHQLDEPTRGFSFQSEGPLDMRMGDTGQTAGDFLDSTDQQELARVLKVYGEVNGAWRIAGAILEARGQGRLETTKDLAELMEAISPPRYHKKARSIHPATLVFQGLRIKVNEELEHLEEAVRQIPQVVTPGGRAVFISFHSLEDRIIKHGFRTLEDPCTCPPGLPRCGCGAVPMVEVLTRRPVMAKDAENQVNPRARSAKLRAVRVLTKEERESL